MGRTQIREVMLALLILVATCLITISGIRTTVSSTKKEEKAQLELAIRRAIVECYAIEGAYPPDVDYMEAHYGVVVDDNAFIVHYDSFATNVMPDFKVLDRTKEE